MAVELGEFLAEQLARLPENHPDRAYIQGVMAMNDGYIQKGSQERPLPQIEQFSPETRKALEAQGALIYTLTGQSIKDLREAGRPFWLSWHEDQEFETVPSRLSEVAINPSQVFLKGSNRKPMKEQLTMLENYGRELAGKIPGAQAVLGSAPDYAELAFGHLDGTGKYLFGLEYNYDYTRTVTPTSGSHVALVGSFYPDFGLNVHYYRPDRSNDDIWAAPLVVPAQK